MHLEHYIKQELCQNSNMCIFNNVCRKWGNICRVTMEIFHGGVEIILGQDFDVMQIFDITWVSPFRSFLQNGQEPI